MDTNKDSSSGEVGSIPPWVFVVLWLALSFGVVMRWLWAEDMVYRGDEIWLYERSQNAGVSEPWPKTGMPTSLGIPNPGLSVWWAIALGWFVHTPPSMVRIVITLNIAALLGIVLLVRKVIPAERREPWLWAWALMAVNGNSVQLSRKIWQQSFLPPWVLALFAGHLYRATRWGGLLWGLAGGLIGQIHMSGFFLAASLFFGTILQELRAKRMTTRWVWWFAGSLLSIVPMLTWLDAMRTATSTAEPTRHTLRVMAIRAYLIAYNWVIVGTGLNQLPLLGIDRYPFLEGPVVFGQPTYFVFGLMLLIVGLTLVLTLRGVLRLVVTRSLEPSSEAWFYALSCAVGTSLLYFFIVAVHWDHYLFIFAPFLFLTFALVAMPDRKLLAALVLAQAMFTTSFMIFIHTNGGAEGDYQASWATQQKFRPSIPPPAQ